MRTGSPYKFAVFADVVEEWNDNSGVFKNGVLLFCVDGHLFPQEVVTATLSSEMQPFRESLMNIKVNKNLFNMPKERAYI